jgi:hypothetical protein
METSSGRDSARPSICFYVDDSQMELQRLREIRVNTTKASKDMEGSNLAFVRSGCWPCFCAQADEIE